MANKNITDTFYGGSNQIARLPYKTIDALQQIGLYIEPNPNDDAALYIKSETQDMSPSKTVDLGLNIDNDQIITQKLVVGGYMDLPQAPGKTETYPIWDLFTQIIDTDYNISGTGELPKEIVKLIKNIRKPYILTGNDQSVLLMTDPSGLNGLFIKANGKVMNWVSVNAITGGLTFTSVTGIQYVHMMKIVSTAGDTCYLTVISPMAKRSTTNYLTVKLYIAGGLTTADGTSAGSMTGEFACSGYNSTTNKTIVALDLGENKFVYSDGTKSAEALSASNTTVTGNIYGQKN